MLDATCIKEYFQHLDRLNQILKRHADSLDVQDRNSDLVVDRYQVKSSREGLRSVQVEGVRVCHISR